MSICVSNYCAAKIYFEEISRKRGVKINLDSFWGF